MPHLQREPDDPNRPSRRAFSNIGRRVVVIWLILLPILTTVALRRRWSELGRIAEALRAADPRWVAVGIGIEVALLLMAGLVYHLLLRRLGHRLSCLTLASAHLQRAAVGAISPLSGPASVYVFLHLLGRRKIPVQDGVLTLALRSAAGQTAFVLILIAAVALRGSVSMLLIAGGIVAAAIVVVPRAGRPLALRWQSRPLWPQRLPRVVEQWVVEFRARFRCHRLRCRDLLWPLVLTVGMRVGAAALLFASMRALGVDGSPATAVTVYLAALLAHVAVPVFGGAGAVEAAAAVALRHAGVPLDLAVGVALLWRLIDFWLPVGVGLAAHATTMLPPVVARVAVPLTAESARSSAALGLRPIPLARRRPPPPRGRRARALRDRPRPMPARPAPANATWCPPVARWAPYPQPDIRLEVDVGASVAGGSKRGGAARWSCSPVSRTGWTPPSPPSPRSPATGARGASSAT